MIVGPLKSHLCYRDVQSLGTNRRPYLIVYMLNGQGIYSAGKVDEDEYRYTQCDIFIQETKFAHLQRFYIHLYCSFLSNFQMQTIVFCDLFKQITSQEVKIIITPCNRWHINYGVH
jgi:hypothetical protein